MPSRKNLKTSSATSFRAITLLESKSCTKKRWRLNLLKISNWPLINTLKATTYLFLNSILLTKLIALWIKRLLESFNSRMKRSTKKMDSKKHILPSIKCRRYLITKKKSKDSLGPVWGLSLKEIDRLTLQFRKLLRKALTIVTEIREVDSKRRTRFTSSTKFSTIIMYDFYMISVLL